MDHHIVCSIWVEPEKRTHSRTVLSGGGCVVSADNQRYLRSKLTARVKLEWVEISVTRRKSYRPVVCLKGSNPCSAG